MAILQGALIDLGHRLTISVAKYGVPDGIFGRETHAAVLAFQKRKGLGLRSDGVVGQHTVLALDALMVAKAPTVPTPPALPSAPSNDHYRIGTDDPPLRSDPGAGTWNSTPATLSHAALKAAIVEILPHAYVVIGDDATKHMAHYLRNSGSAFKIDLEDMIRDVPSARERFEAEVAQARTFVESLGPGGHSITSQKVEGGYNTKDESVNWFFAIGGYSSWGKGTATVKDGPAGREHELEFEYRFYDRYNWDRGKSVTIFGITVSDEFMGEFHRQGLAREFDCLGSVRRRFTWRKGESIPKGQMDAPPGGRS